MNVCIYIYTYIHILYIVYTLLPLLTNKLFVCRRSKIGHANCTAVIDRAGDVATTIVGLSG